MTIISIGVFKIVISQLVKAKNDTIKSYAFILPDNNRLDGYPWGEGTDFELDQGRPIRIRTFRADEDLKKHHIVLKT